MLVATMRFKPQTLMLSLEGHGFIARAAQPLPRRGRWHDEATRSGNTDSGLLEGLR